MTDPWLDSETSVKQHSEGSIIELAAIVKSVLATAHAKAVPLGFDSFEVLGGVTAQCIKGLTELVQDEAVAIAFFREIVSNWEEEVMRSSLDQIRVPEHGLLH